MKKNRPVFKTTRGKFYLSNWILNNFPSDYEQLNYIKPFAGGLSVLLNKQPSDSEAVNDVDLHIIQIYRALRDEPGNFIGRLKRIKYCPESFLRVGKKIHNEDYVDQAMGELVLRRMSKGGNKNSFDETGENSWLIMIDELPNTAKRLENINIFNKSALDVIGAFDDHDFLCYCDPPCPTLKEECSMTIDEHIKLSELLNQYRGKSIISAPYSKLFKRLYDGWRCVQKKSVGRKTECLWMNY